MYSSILRCFRSRTGKWTRNKETCSSRRLRRLAARLCTSRVASPPITTFRCQTLSLKQKLSASPEDTSTYRLRPPFRAFHSVSIWTWIWLIDRAVFESQQAIFTSKWARRTTSSLRFLSTWIWTAGLWSSLTLSTSLRCHDCYPRVTWLKAAIKLSRWLCAQIQLSVVFSRPITNMISWHYLPRWGSNFSLISTDGPSILLGWNSQLI